MQRNTPYVMTQTQTKFSSFIKKIEGKTQHEEGWGFRFLGIARASTTVRTGNDARPMAGGSIYIPGLANSICLAEDYLDGRIISQDYWRKELRSSFSFSACQGFVGNPSSYFSMLSDNHHLLTQRDLNFFRFLYELRKGRQ